MRDTFFTRLLLFVDSLFCAVATSKTSGAVSGVGIPSAFSVTFFPPCSVIAFNGLRLSDAILV